MRTPAELAADLVTLGVRPGDLLFLHASLRRIGPVVGGATGVIEAVEQAIGPEGTVMMVLGSRNDWDWVNTRPEAERAQLLADAEPFDGRRTPALPEVGTLAEVMRTMPGTVVNNHPEGRFAARGRLAGELLADLPWDYYYGPGSALDRFVAAGGRVLRLGANPDTVTVLHFAEYGAEVPEKVKARRHRKVLDEDGGTEVVVVECLDDEFGIVAKARQPEQDYFSLILEQFLATGRAHVGTVGGAQAELFAAAEIVAFGTAWMTEHLR